MKSRYVSTATECMTSSISPNGSPALETIYSKFHHLRRILEEDSSSDNSSLISSNSDEGSCSTDSTCESTSTDDFADYIFGDLGRGWCGKLRNSDSDTSSALPSIFNYLIPCRSMYLVYKFKDGVIIKCAQVTNHLNPVTWFLA
ncbi:ubiquitin carboxyl-terminal hydrolase 16-like [Gastrolobium bilobum]|uniref:ubiquitin carboxyl-terminal hydrolase 16-like n=1 Tax=Gastrolobium bilobum TaxID=150636 RepID=UPI002AAF9D69|nr:ubiquitin carboxyl-terminal hydrolase 16-like [Gastrolobium bilobum]